MYNKAKCKVKWKGKVGNEIESNFGVLQGGMMSPRLFTEFLTDLKEYLDTTCGVKLDNNTINYILYADDMVLCSDSALGLQKLIDGLYDYCKKWHLIVSLAKTNVMAIGTKEKDHTFKFGNDKVNMTDSYKYLGTVISNDKDMFKQNQVNLINKSNNAIYALNAYIKHTVGQLQPSLALKMFDVQISPVMEYASEVWFQNKKLNVLEKIHLGFLKNTLKTKMSTSTIVLYSELGRFPLAIKIKCRLLNYWKRVLGFDTSHPVKQAYDALCNMHNRGQTNWCTTLKAILQETNKMHLWNEQNITERQFQQIKESLYKDFMTMTIEQINDSDSNPKLRTYKLFKHQFQFESFLSTPTNLNYALSLTKFRISSHNLAIETGRYTKPKTQIQDRLCIHCNHKEIETEQHFLLACPLYNEERILLMETLSLNIPQLDNLENDGKFILIMSNRDKQVTDALGKFSFHSFKKRNQIIS